MPAIGVEALDRLHEPEHALLHQVHVRDGRVGRPQAASDVCDEGDVGLDHLVASAAVALAHEQRQSLLLRCCEWRCRVHPGARIWGMPLNAV